jgi:hypothetical protein
VWNPARVLERSAPPSNGQIHEVLCEGFDGKAYDEERAARYATRQGFYDPPLSRGLDAARAV